MAGPAPTTLTIHKDRSAGPVHSSGNYVRRAPRATVLYEVAVWRLNRFWDTQHKETRHDE